MGSEWEIVRPKRRKSYAGGRVGPVPGVGSRSGSGTVYGE